MPSSGSNHPRLRGGGLHQLLEEGPSVAKNCEVDLTSSRALAVSVSKLSSEAFTSYGCSSSFRVHEGFGT